MSSQGPTLFYLSIQAVLKSWVSLQLAVDNSFGGPQSKEKAQWFVGAIEEYFDKNANLQEDEVESMLNSVMVDEFDVVEEGGDALFIAKDICKFYSLWKNNKHDVLKQKLSKLPRANVADCQSGETEQQKRVKTEELSMARMNMDDVEEMEEEEEEIPDPDGWVEVKPKRKNKKRSRAKMEETTEMAASSNMETE